MPTYIVTNKTTGDEIYRYDAAQKIEWTGMEFATHDHTEAPVINTDGSIEGVATPVIRRLTKLAFVGRLGSDFATILAAAKTNVQVELFVKMLDWATPDPDGTSVDLDDQRVIDALNTLEAAGLIAAGRANEVLSNPPQQTQIVSSPKAFAPLHRVGDVAVMLEPDGTVRYANGIWTTHDTLLGQGKTVEVI